jgi:hypothetical protein
MEVESLRIRLPSKLSISLTAVCGADLYYSDGVASGYTHKLSIHDGTTPKLIAFVNEKDVLSTFCSETKYEDCVKEWITSKGS